MNDQLRTYLSARGEHYAVGLFEAPDAPPVRRIARAMRRHLEACALCPEHTPPLYPAGRYSLWDQGAAARFHYSFPFQFDPVRWSGHVGAERRKTQALLRAYFALGNQQIQINVVDQALLQAAIADPGAYRDLVVRVAGYSEYFDRLTPALRQSVLERTIHTL